MRAYYNEIDPFAAAWLRNLIAAGHIAPGDVDERSIVDVRADDVRGYTQCHFFAGIGVWSYALRRAGWPDDRPVWTGSCPCQPFSVAGKRGGHEDERHLWPAWFGLIGESRPLRIFGEQVANGDGYAWLDDVGHDLEGIEYALGALCPAACGVGAPHERQRLYFVANADEGRGWRNAGAIHREEAKAPLRQEPHGAELGSSAVGLADTPGARPAWRAHPGAARATERESGRQGNQSARRVESEGNGAAVSVVDPHDSRLSLGNRDAETAWQGGAGAIEAGAVIELGDAAPGGLGEHRSASRDGRHAAQPGPTNGFWSGAEWVYCRDRDGPRWRPVEPGSFPLVARASERVGRLRAYGNALCAPLAEEFIRAYMQIEGLAA